MKNSLTTHREKIREKYRVIAIRCMHLNTLQRCYQLSILGAFLRGPVTRHGSGASCLSGCPFSLESHERDRPVRCHRPPSSSVATNPGSLVPSPLTLHLTVPTDFPHANAVDESPSFFSSSFSPFSSPLSSLQLLGPPLDSSFSLLSLRSRLEFNVGTACER